MSEDAYNAEMAQERVDALESIIWSTLNFIKGYKMIIPSENAVIDVIEKKLLEMEEL